MISTINNRMFFSSAMGYVLYSPVNSSENLPPFPASIKDGYAIKYINEDCWSQKSNIFNVVQVSVAGTVVSIYFILCVCCCILYFCYL